MNSYFNLLKRYRITGKTMFFMLMLVFLNIAETLNIKLFTAVLDDINNEKLWIIMILVGLFVVFESKFAYKYMINICENFKKDHKTDLFNKVVYYSVDQLGETNMAKIISAIDGANSLADNMIRDIPEWILYLVVSAVTSVIIMARENLTLLIIVLIEIVPLCLSISYGKMKTKDLSKERKKIELKTYSIIERLYGYVVTKSFSKESYEINEFDNVSEEYKISSFKKRYLNNYIETIARGLNFLINITWLLYGYWAYKHNCFSIPEIMLFSRLTGNLINPFYNINNINQELIELNTHMRIANEILNAKTEYNGETKLEDFSSSIEFKNVSFNYENSGNILKNISFKIPKGSKVGIYGESGAGKSSLVNLLMRFFLCNEGEILIDGININKFTNESLRKHIGIINQEIYLFSNMTIKENIMYSNPNCLESEMIEAAKKANCHDFIMKLPNGYNSYIGNNGVKLSGGERQRVALARLFLLNPEILILDEATSKLDNISEFLIKEAIDRLSKDKTVINIAHRFTTIEDSDILIGIEDHTVKEIGTKESLNKEGTLFYKLYHCN